MPKSDCPIYPKIGLIGIGLVGTAIAERLLRAGYEVIGCDTAPDRTQHLATMGGTVAGSPQAVSASASQVILSLPDTAAVRAVIAGPQGILSAKRKPAHVIDTTTGDPEETVQLAQSLLEEGVLYLDATISGSSGQIAKREAVFMVGGPRSAFEECKGLLGHLSDHLFHLGPSGSGSRAKLATNLILGLNRLALAEGMVFAEKLGIPLDQFLALLKISPAYSAAVDVKGAKMLHDDFKPVSRIKQHHKDVALILKYADMNGQRLPLSQVHLDILEKAMAAGDSDLDTSAVIREIRRRTMGKKD